MKPANETPEPSSTESGRPWRWTWVRGYLSALTLTTLLSGAFIGMMFSALNRQAFLWGRQDTVELFLLVALLALLAWAGVAGLDRLTRGWVRRFGRHGIFIVIPAAVLQLLPAAWLRAQGHWLYPAMLVAGILLAAASLLAGGNRFVERAWRATVPLACLYPLLMASLLAAMPLDQPRDIPAMRAAAGDPARPPVFIVFFDGLAKDICTAGDGNWKPELKNLDAFRRDALDFSRATSAGRRTTDSIPNFLFQRDPAAFNRIDWADDFLDYKPTTFTNGVFFHAKQAGYRTLLSGMYLPYRQLLGPLLDKSSAMELVRYADRHTWHQRLLNHAASILIYARGFFHDYLLRKIPQISWRLDGVYSAYFSRMVAAGIANVREQVGRSFGPQDLFFVHLPVPHNPTVFLEDGTVDSARATYWTQVQYSDRVWGEIVAVLRQADVYDSGWILLSADHGSLPPTDLSLVQRHVPLLVKPPTGTFAPQRIDAALQMWEMGPFFEAVFQGKPTAECLARLAPSIRPLPAAVP